MLTVPVLENRGKPEPTGGGLIKKKRKFSSNIRKFGMEQLQSHTYMYEEGLPNI
jgi:hypothetical protein